MAGCPGLNKFLQWQWPIACGWSVLFCALEQEHDCGWSLQYLSDCFVLVGEGYCCNGKMHRCSLFDVHTLHIIIEIS